jgi:hypothetical protein
MMSGDPGAPSLNVPRPAKQSTIMIGCWSRWLFRAFSPGDVPKSQHNSYIPAFYVQTL